MTTNHRDHRSTEHHVLVRIVHPRRNFPEMIVFLNGVVVHTDSVWRDDARMVAEQVVAHADEIAAAYSPASAAARLVHEAVLAA